MTNPKSLPDAVERVKALTKELVNPVFNHMPVADTKNRPALAADLTALLSQLDKLETERDSERVMRITAAEERADYAAQLNRAEASNASLAGALRKIATRWEARAVVERGYARGERNTGAAAAYCSTAAALKTCAASIRQALSTPEYGEAAADNNRKGAETPKGFDWHAAVQATMPPAPVQGDVAGLVEEALKQARKPTRYPDYLDDPDGYERIREAARTGNGHDMATVNNNSMWRIVETIERLQRALAILSALAAPPSPSKADVGALVEAIETAWRRGGGFGHLAKTPTGRKTMAEMAAREALASFAASHDGGL